MSEPEPACVCGHGKSVHGWNGWPACRQCDCERWRRAAVHVTITTTKTAQPQSYMSQDGVYVVGQDIEPGTYHTSGAVGGSGGDCYYALLSSTNTSNIIDNNNVTGPATITVGPGVKAVQVSGCQPWQKIG